MTDTALNTTVEEQHAPDPMVNRGDPLPPGKLAIWLFLASEIMFFIGLLGTYIVLRSGSVALFEAQSAMLNKLLAGVNTLVLIFSSLTMALAVDAAQRHDRLRLAACLFLTLAMACAFMGIKTVEYSDKFHHYTILAREGNGSSAKIYIYDGHLIGPASAAKGAVWKLEGKRRLVPKTETISVHTFTPDSDPEMKKESEEKEYEIAFDNINDSTWYGPQKNIFFSCYFALTGIHGLHVLGGMFPLGILLVQALRGKVFAAHTEYLGLYWHFVDLVWIFLFPLLYLI